MTVRSGRGRICVAVEGRYLAHEQPAATVRTMRELGHEVHVLVTDLAVLDLHRSDDLDGVDLAVCRGRSETLLCWLALAEQAGIPTVNRRDALLRVVHKEITTASLARSGLPVAPTWLLPSSRVRELPADVFPIVVKPPTGDNGRGIRVIADPDAAASFRGCDVLVLAQSFIPFDGEDLKLYVVGDHVSAVRKPSPLQALASGARWAAGFGRAGSPRPWPVTAELRDIALSCATLTGLDLLGVDLVLGPDGPVVVEVNDFPNYTAVPDASRHLASLLLSHLGRSTPCVSLC